MESALGGEPSDIDGAPKGERAGASESNEPARGAKVPCPRKPSVIWRRGRESNPRIEVLQTPTLPLGYPAALANGRVGAANVHVNVMGEGRSDGVMED
jgi:hypothetical protein